MLEKLLSEKLVKAAIVVVIFSIIYFIFNRIIKKITKSKTSLKRIDNKKHKTLLVLSNNIVKYFLIIVAIIMILNIYGFNTNSLIASLGVASAVAALAFQDTLKDFLAGIFIVIENQYDIGDTVTINGFKGEVVGVGLRTTKLKAYNGEYCFVANRNVGDVINHSLSKSLAIVKVQVSYEEDIEKVEKVLTKLCTKLTKELPNLKSEVKLDGIDDLGDSGITFLVTAETEPLKNYEIQRIIRKEIKLEFDKNNIEIPYPQVVVHNA